MQSNYIDYLNFVDDTHPMTTSVKHIQLLCEVIKNKSNKKILELGSYLGISTAAMALACPDSLIISVDLSDHISSAQRINYWNSLGIKNIQSFSTDSLSFIQSNDESYDLIFHDAVHGDSAIKEYLMCAKITGTLAIHDFEQLNKNNQQLIIDLFVDKVIDFDNKGRCLFIGFKEQNS